MAKSLADKIEQYIKVLLERSEHQEIEIQRAELAETFCCVPSQVTYVIATRFTREEGYYTESRRGGKGYVRITKLPDDVETVYGGSRQEFFSYLDELGGKNIISQQEKELLKYLADYAFSDMQPQQKRQILASMILAIENFFK